MKQTGQSLYYPVWFSSQWYVLYIFSKKPDYFTQFWYNFVQLSLELLKTKAYYFHYIANMIRLKETRISPERV